jgi:hypothetical protein
MSAAAEEFSIDGERNRLGEFLANGSLYVRHVIAGPPNKFDNLPGTISLYCSGATCQKVQLFQKEVLFRAAQASEKGYGSVVKYTCRNCKEMTQRYMYIWQENNFWKVGQSPELLEHIPSTLARALGSSGSLYRKALRSRSFGFGIGALAYLRRIVEDTTDKLLTLLREDLWENWDEASRTEFENAVNTFRYSEKIGYAAKKVLPKEAFSEGRNPFAALHDVTSNGIHALPEEQCLKIFDECNFVFTHTFTVLYQHHQTKADFALQLAKLQRDTPKKPIAAAAEPGQAPESDC